MIIVKSIQAYRDDQMIVGLFSDTKTEVGTTPVTDIQDFPQGYTIAPGSSVTTADGHFAWRQSDGEWNWRA